MTLNLCVRAGNSANCRTARSCA